MTEANFNTPGELTAEERSRRFIETGDFYAANKDVLRDLFTALNRSDRWSEDPTDPDFVSYLRSGWIGSEHGNSTDKDQFTDEEKAAALPFFRRLGLADEKLPPENMHFDRAFVAGGTTQALYRRTGTTEKAVREHGVTIDVVDVASGQRPREKRDGTNKELLSSTGRFGGTDIIGQPWIKAGRTVGHDEKGRFISRFSESIQADTNKKWQLTETDLARIALGKHVSGTMRAHRINLQLTDLNDPHAHVPAKLDNTPARLITSYEYENENRQFRVMNAPAVSRGKAEPRPTTDSTAQEWLATTDLPEGAAVLFVTSNPHADRMARSFHRTLAENGRNDLRVSVAATSAPANADTQLYLGEVARMIDNDLRDNYGVSRN